MSRKKSPQLLTVTITLKDCPDGQLQVHMEFEPFIQGDEPPKTPAAQAAVGILKWIGEQAAKSTPSAESTPSPSYDSDGCTFA